MELEEEIKYLENCDTSEIINMFAEKQYIYSSNNKIVAGKKFEKYYSGYLDRRVKIGPRRVELYRIKNNK